MDRDEYMETLSRILDKVDKAIEHNLIILTEEQKDELEVVRALSRDPTCAQEDVDRKVLKLTQLLLGG